MSAQVLPKELRLSAPPTMPQARSYLFKQQSQNSTYDPGSTGTTIQINIPRLQRSYLTKDSYLKFRVTLPAFTIGASDGLCLDTCGAFGFFDKIEIYDYLGSTLLESTSSHGALLATLLDMASGPDELGFHYNVSSGTVNNAIQYDTVNAGSLTAATTGPFGTAIGAAYNQANLVTATQKLKFTQTGTQHGAVLLNATTAAPTNFEFAIPLFSFLGTLSQKYVPLHNGFTIQLTINPVSQVFGSTTMAGGAPNGTAVNVPATYTMSNVYMCCQILELGPQAESMLLNSAGGKPLVIPTKAFRNFNTTIASLPTSTASTTKLDLNLNVASLTNLLFIMRPTECITGTNAGGMKTFSAHFRNCLQSWYFQYGSSILPQTSGIQTSSAFAQTITNGGHDECYQELMKSRHALNADNFTTQITRDSYIIDGTYDNAVNSANFKAAVALGPSNFILCPKFAAGLDLELVSGRSRNLICGMNTNGMNTAIFLNFYNTSASNVTNNMRLDAWAEYDAFINISPGIATTVSF